MRRIADGNMVPAEVQWLHENFPTNYSIILDIRNESAVAALALHDWALYRYNNNVYTLLFKENSADKNLGAYCSMMQQSESNKNIAIVLLIVCCSLSCRFIISCIIVIGSVTNPILIIFRPLTTSC